MYVLVACEESQAVCKAFRAKGHIAFSCDTEPCSGGHPEWHIQKDVLSILDQPWDLMIGFPPCTYLTTTANRSFLNNPDRWDLRLAAVKFFHKLLNCGIPKIALENPKGVISTHIRKPDQYIQPYEFGHAESKTTGLWLRNLPLLKPTEIVEPVWKLCGSTGKRYSPTHWSSPSTGNPENAKLRSKTYLGIAQAMADQWG